MKRVFMNGMNRWFTFTVMLFLGVFSLIAQVQITPTGVVPSNFETLLRSYVPDDFWDAIFTKDNKTLMDTVYVAAQLPDIPGLCEAGLWLVAFKPSADFTSYTNTSFTNVQKACRVIPNIDGKKLYFTGKCPNASAGTEKNESFVYFNGSRDEKVDVYLHDFEVKTLSKEIPGISINQWLKGYILGNASPIAIGSTSDDTTAPFTVNFHIRGNNKLTGGATTKVRGADNLLAEMLCDILYLSAAPIAIRPIAEVPAEDASDKVVATGLERYRNIATKLTFDDVWPTAADGSTTIRTNGLLELPVEGDLGAPSIDLGNSKGQVEFNGGRYKFHTPRTNSMFYVSSLAICYRSITLAGFETIGAGGSVSAGSASEEVSTRDFRDVVFNDGSFSTYSADKIAVTPDDPTLVDVVQKGWYVHNTDLRVPYNTRIYGGTFNNCEVYRCDGSGEQGVPPVSPTYFDVVTQVDPETGKDKEVQVPKPLCRIPIQVSAKDETGVATTFADPENRLPSDYGKLSLTPIVEGNQDNVYIYTHIGCNPTLPVYSRNWVTLIPKMGYEKLLTMGGNQTVYNKTTDGTKDLMNKYLFYARLNEYTKQNAFIELAGIPVGVQVAINKITGEPEDANYNPELEFSGVTNTDSYRIDNALYTMLSFPSNEWQLISLPYDVHRVWVLETTEKQFEGNPNNPEEIEAFLKEQGEADGDLAQQIVTSLCPDIFSGKGSGVNMNLIDIAKEQIGLTPFELKHYNGKTGAESNASQAHYYLYEQVNECDDDGYGGEDKLSSGIGLWRLETSVGQYSNKWKPAPTYSALKNADGSAYKDLDGNVAPPVLMQKGRIYSLFLPSGKDRYWDGKYLIFEGYGPQSVAGTSAHDNFLKYQELTTPDEVEGDEYEYGIEMLGLQGNITFANYKTTETTFLPAKDAPTESKGYWYHFDKTEPGAMIRPGQVYAGMSETATGNATALTPLGMIRRVDTTTDDARPVVGDILLYAYSQAGSLILDSHADQYVQVVSVDGRMLFAGQLHDGEQKHISATTGVYIVRSNEQVIKLMVP